MSETAGGIVGLEPYPRGRCMLFIFNVLEGLYGHFIRRGRGGFCLSLWVYWFVKTNPQDAQMSSWGKYTCGCERFTLGRGQGL